MLIHGIFFVAAICGGLAWHSTAKVCQRNYDRFQPVLRVMFGTGVWMSVWVCVTYALWLANGLFKVEIDSDYMSTQWWLGPMCIVFSAWCYSVLKNHYG